MKNDNRMGANEIAKELGCSPRTVAQWHHHGRYADTLNIKKGLNGRLYAFREDVMKFKELWLYGSHDAAREAEQKHA